MILDWQADRDHADRHEILDAATGEPLPMSPPYDMIFHADDEASILRYRLRDEEGNCYFALPDGRKVVDQWKVNEARSYGDLATGTEKTEVVYSGAVDATLSDGTTVRVREEDIEIAWAEERKAIRIVPKCEPAAPRQESWRDRPAML